MLANANDIKLVGPNDVIRILVEEIKSLESEGIVVNGKVVFIASGLLILDVSCWSLTRKRKAFWNCL